jgi:lipopolysaccharide transport system permease protein
MMYDILPQITWFALPILIIVQFSFVLAVAMLASALIPFLPDLRVAIDNGLLLLFFVSGIFFNINEVHEPLQTYLYLNPMAGLIDGYRSIMIRGEWPNFNYLAQIFLVTILVGTFAALLLKRLDRVYAKVRI